MWAERSDLKRGWRLLLLWLPALAYMAAIFWMSSRSDPIPGLRLVGGTDKIAHAAAYSLLGFLLARAFVGSFPTRGLVSMALVGALVGTFYGVTDELHQTFVPGRHGNVFDVAANTLGAFLGASAFLVVARYRRGSIVSTPDGGRAAAPNAGSGPAGGAGEGE